MRKSIKLLAWHSIGLQKRKEKNRYGRRKKRKRKKKKEKKRRKSQEKGKRNTEEEKVMCGSGECARGSEAG